MSVRFRLITYVAAVLVAGLGLAIIPAAEVAAQEVLFSDGFESGDFTNWSTVDTEWTTVNFSNAEGSWKARAGADTPATSSVLVKYLDTTGYENIRISFSHQDNGLEEADSVELQTTYTGGSSWVGPGTELKGSDSGWSAQDIPFTNSTAADTPSFGFRFIATLDSKTDEFDLDDIVVTGEPIEEEDDASDSGSGQPDVTLANPVPADTATVTGMFDIQIEVTGDTDGLRDGGPVTVSLFDMSSSDGDGANDYFAFLSTTTTSVWEVTGIDSTDPTVGIDGEPLNDGQYRMEIKAIGEGDVKLDSSVTNFTIMNDGDDANDEREPVYGCTDEEAVNYDLEATHDNEGCEYADETLPEQCLDGNLLDNASFESPVVEAEQNFAFIANPAAWLVATVAADAPAELEFHRGWQGNEAAAGAQYVELDGNESVAITQTVSGLEAGAEYTLFWDFAARQDTEAVNNHLEVALDGIPVATSGPMAGSGVVAADDWVSGSHTFTAAGTSREITFTDIGTNDSYGTFLDDTVLCQTAPAPELEPTEWTWEGHKYRDETGAGELTDDLVGEPNWGMELVLSNDGALEVVATTTTEADGSYEFTLEAEEVPEWARFSDFAVREEMRDGWTSTGVYADGRSLEYNPEDAVCGAFYEGERELVDIPLNDFGGEGDYQLDIPRAFSVRCDFLNEPPEEPVEEDDPVVEEEDEEEDDGTTYGTRVRREPQPEPQVLGAATSTDPAPQCGRLLHSFMQQGEATSEQQVQLLQIFLNGQGYLVPVTGEFDAATDEAVRDFQQAHQEEVLVPWYEAGLMDHQNPTGYVYRTTRWKINNLVCPGSEDFPELR